MLRYLGSCWVHIPVRLNLRDSTTGMEKSFWKLQKQIIDYFLNLKKNKNPSRSLCRRNLSTSGLYIFLAWSPTAITIQGDSHFRRLLFRPFLTLSNFYMSYPAYKVPIHHFPILLNFLGMPWGSPFLCQTVWMSSQCLDMPTSESFLPAPQGLFPCPHHSLFIYTCWTLMASSLHSAFTPLLILLFLQWEDKQRWNILLSCCLLLIALICGQLQILL